MSLAAAACLVLLIPGAFGEGTSSLFFKQMDYFAEYRAFFQSKGCEARVLEFPPDATIELRASVLGQEITKASAADAGRAVYLVAHSQGGLDARFALRTKALSGVRALAMVGVPNQGTPLAEWALKQRSSWGSPLYWLLRVLGRYDLRAIPFAAEMTPAFLTEKASYFSAVPGVRYGSARGACRTSCAWALRAGAWWLGLGPGDGLVPEESQRLGSDLGEYDLDHISEVGVDPRKHAERQRLLDAIWAFFQAGRAR